MSDSGKIITQCGAVKLALDLLEVDDRTESVRVGFELQHNSPRQNLIYRRSGSWIEYKQIDAFAAILRKESAGYLLDLSEYPVLEIESTDSGFLLRISPLRSRESKEAEEMRVQVVLDPDFPQKLSEAINAFPRWW